MNEVDGPSQDEVSLAKEKVDKLLRHITNVQEACHLLAKRLIEKGEINLGIRLVALGQLHDASKWSGIEFEYLIEPPLNTNGTLSLAIKQHQSTNRHHIEYWEDANDMPRLYIAEMVCDLYARAGEFGTSVWDYIKEEFLPKHNISKNGRVYKTIKEFLDLLLEKPFKDS
jgi:hypothetical protein